MMDALDIMNCYLNAETQSDQARCEKLEEAYQAKYSKTLFGSFED